MKKKLLSLLTALAVTTTAVIPTMMHVQANEVSVSVPVEIEPMESEIPFVPVPTAPPITGDAIVTEKPSEDPNAGQGSVNIPIAPAPAIKVGDISGDNKVRLDDAQSVLKFALAISRPTDEQKQAADINKDGKVTLEDAQLVLKGALAIINLDKYIPDENKKPANTEAPVVSDIPTQTENTEEIVTPTPEETQAPQNPLTPPPAIEPTGEPQEIITPTPEETQTPVPVTPTPEPEDEDIPTPPPFPGDTPSTSEPIYKGDVCPYELYVLTTYEGYPAWYSNGTNDEMQSLYTYQFQQPVIEQGLNPHWGFKWVGEYGDAGDVYVKWFIGGFEDVRDFTN